MHSLSGGDLASPLSDVGERERFLVNGVNAVEYPACDEVSYPLGIAKCCNPESLGQAAGIFGRCGSREPEAAIHESLAKTSISIGNKEARFASVAHARLTKLVIQCKGSGSMAYTRRR